MSDRSEHHVPIESSAAVAVDAPACPAPGSRTQPADARDSVGEMDRVLSELRKVSRAVEQSPVSVMITDRNGAIEYVNPRFSEVTGYAASEVLGRNPRILKSGQNSAETYAELWQTILSGHEWNGELLNRKKNGELFWERASISPVRDGSGAITHFVGVKEDVTQRKALEEQFRQAHKMEAVGRLAGGVAHDFNNLLGVIMGYADLALRRSDLDVKLRRQLFEIHRTAERAAALTRQLLAFSRKQVLQPTVIDVGSVVHELERMLHRLIGEDIALTLRCDATAPRVYADPSQIEQVLLNLAVNARDAMPEGGELLIETRGVELDEASLLPDSELRPGSYLMLAVTDSGPGIPAAIRDRIFEPFFTTKSDGKGTGLGLATVYGIVRQSGGFIQLESEPGRGATFRLYFPEVAREIAPAEEPLPAQELAGCERILLVEDDAALRDVTQEFLAVYGYQVTAARSGAEALRLAGESACAFDLLLTDVVMPGISGRELAASMQRRHPELPVIFTSGYTAERLGHQGVLEPGFLLVHKPCEAKALVAAVRAALDRRPPADC
jgi:PAS domain S-box-containing protein